jgi:molybdenum cofactor biosynthesis enzyme MoaA
VTSIVPRIIDLELTNACPADCEMCPREKLPKLGVMKREVFERLLADFGASPTLEWISLCGIGEPLLHPKVVDWVRELAVLPSRPKVGLVTGGERLTSEMYEALIEAGLSQIEISVQAVDRDLYRTLMPGLDFDRVMANLDYISTHRHSHVDIGISHTRHLTNAHHVDDMRRYVSNLGFTLTVTRIHSRAGNLVRPHLLAKRQPAPPQARECRIFEKIAFVAWTGRVQYCCHDIERAHVVGDVAVESLADINARKTALVMEHGGPPADICARCDDPLRVRL